jgi:hypothetical protein
VVVVGEELTIIDEIQLDLQLSKQLISAVEEELGLEGLADVVSESRAGPVVVATDNLDTELVIGIGEAVEDVRPWSLSRL